MPDIYQNISDRAYFKHLEHPCFDNPQQNWSEAKREELLEQKIREEAYLIHQRTHGDELSDYLKAKQYVDERIKFLAYLIHEKNYNEKPIDVWVKAQDLYINNF